MKKRFKIPLYLFSFLLLAGLIFWGLLTQTKLLESRVNRLLGVFLENKYSIKINVGDISGSFWRELVIKDVTVDLLHTDTTYGIAQIPQLKLNYRLSNLWRKRWIVDSLTVVRPHFAIIRTEDGKFLVALPTGERRMISKTGLFDFKLENIKIQAGSLDLFSAGKRFAIQDLNLEAWLSRDPEGIKLNILRGDLEFPQKDLLLKDLRGFLWFKKDSLYIEGLKIETEDSDVQISGKVGNLLDPHFWFSVKAEPINLTDIRKMAGVGLEGVLKVKGTCEGNFKRFEGRASLNGSFFGRDFQKIRTQYIYRNKKLIFSSIGGKAFGSSLNGKGMFDFGKRPEEYEFEGQTHHLNLNHIIFESLETDLSGHIRLQGRSTSEKEFFMQVKVNLGNGKIEQYSFSAAEGAMDLTTSAVVFHPQFHLDYKNTRVTLKGELEYGGEINLEAQVDFRDLRDFREQIFIKEMKGRGRAWVKVSGKTKDFDIKGEFKSDSCYAYQLFSSNAEIGLQLNNFLSKPKGEVNVRFLEGETWGISYDSLISQIEVNDQVFKIDSARLHNQNLGLNFWGELNLSQTPQVLLIYQIGLDFRGNPLEALSPTVVEIDSQKIKIRKFVLSGRSGQIDVSGEIDYQERMNLSVNVSGLDISPWAGLVSAEPVKGQLSLKALLRGDFRNPEIEGQVAIQQLVFRDMELGRLRTDLAYQEKRLQIKDIVIADAGWEYVGDGFLPIDLSFVSVEQRVLNQPLKFKFHIQGERLELIRLFIPQIEYLVGKFQGDLDITGTFFHPQFDGKMGLREGSLKFVQLSDPVEQLVVEMRMKNEELILKKLSGFVEHRETEERIPFKKIWRIFSSREKVKGEVTGFGSINLKDIHNINYELYFSGDKIPINYEYADLSAMADLSVEITGRSPPMITAQIFLSQLLYREPFTTTGSGNSLSSGQTEGDQWDWNLDISAPNNCWIINDDVKLEFQGDVMVLREGGELRILGDLKTIRGKYFLYGTKFTIEKGSFFFDNIEKIDPKIDFLVSTRLMGGSSASSGQTSLMSTGSGDRVRLAIKGTLSEPKVEPAPDSPYSKEDILELLAFQRGFSSVDSGGMGSLFQERVIKSLGGAYSSRFLESIAGQTLGVETFEIIPTWSEKLRLTDAQITIGKYLSDKVYLRYTRRLSQSSGQETGVEYRLNKNLLLEGRKDKLGLFHLGLNLNWEY